jgi:hypothetical protein
MTLLSIIDNVSRELKFGAVTSVVGNSDENVRALLAAAKRDGKHLASRVSLQTLVEEATHTALAAEEQGDIQTIAPGFDRWVFESAWNRTTRLPLIGPVDGTEWQHIKARDISAATPYYRLRGDQLLIYPVPTAGHVIAFEYFTRYWVKAQDGTLKADFTDDEDASRINETIIELGLLWRFKEAEGLDYAENKRDYETALKNATLTSNARRIVMGRGRGGLSRTDYRVTAAP